MITVAERRGPTDQGRFKRVRKADEEKALIVRKGAGRPLLLDDEMETRICNLIRAGNYIDTAARVAGVSKASLYEWFKRAHRGEQPFAKFLDAVERASSEAEASNVARIMLAATEHWQAAAWWLERTKPKKYGRKIEISEEENAMQSQHKKVDLSKLSEKDLLELKRLRAKVAIADDEQDDL